MQERDGQCMNAETQGQTWKRGDRAGNTVQATLIGILLLVLVACSAPAINGPGANVTPTQPAMNGFGTAANHTHSMLAFSNKTLLLATHYGLFTSLNQGKSWQKVAGGPGQVMDGLMTTSLTSSPLNPNRLYVLTYPALTQHQGILGLYTSDDQGQSWTLATRSANLATDNIIYLAQAGNETADQVYIYIPTKGRQGLLMSMDAGKHFSETGTLPFSRISALLVLPGTRHELLIGSNDGMAHSNDGGKTWEKGNGIQGAVYAPIVTAGPGKPIYVTGDAGVYASRDGGRSFTLVNSQVIYGSLTISPQNPELLYAETEKDLYRSADGGKTWKALPQIKGTLSELVADPNNASQVYLSLSYPTELYHLEGSAWQSLTPGSLNHGG